MTHFKKASVSLVVALLLAIPAMAAETPSVDIPSEVTLFRNVNIFDGENEALLEGHDVLVVKNLIKKIAKDILIADTYEIDVATGGLKEMTSGGFPSDLQGPMKTVMVYEPVQQTKQEVTVKIIDGGGRTLMPGLIDVHWHTTYAYTPARVLMLNQGDMAEVAIRSMTGAKETLMRGFTTVRDPGGNPFAIKKLIDSGEYPGHRILPSGPFMSQTSGHADFHNVWSENPRNSTSELSYWEKNMMAMISDGVPEVRRRTREILKYGATQIKITAGGGVSSQYDPLDVSEYSLDEIRAAVEEAENFNTYVLAHVMTDAGVRNAIEGGVKSIEHGFFASDETLELMKEKGVWLSPQAVFEDDMVWDSPVSERKWKQVVDAVDNVYTKARDLGVNVAFGTDQLFDASKAAQQSLYLVRMGTWFTNHEVLKMVTSDNARLLEMSGPRHPYQEGPLGRIVEGAYADLIIIDGNPMENLELMGDPEENFKIIMKDGVIYKNTLQ